MKRRLKYDFTAVVPDDQVSADGRLMSAAEYAALPKDDFDMPVGKGGLRRFKTGELGSGVILGQAGYQKWKRTEAERGNQVPAWDEGAPYSEESLAAKADALVEDSGPRSEREVFYASGAPARKGKSRVLSIKFTGPDDEVSEIIDSLKKDPNLIATLGFSTESTADGPGFAVKASVIADTSL